MLSPLTLDGLRPRLDALMDELDHRIPRGAGPGGVWHLPGGVDELEDVLHGGSRYAVERGHSTARDIEHCEDRDVVADADPRQVSTRALERGLHQVGSLGSGNHFLEVQAVDAVYDQASADAFGLAVGQIGAMIHCGSRGLGHQVCADYLRIMLAAMPGYHITVPDPQLSCAPARSPEGRSYLGAMAAAANYGRANRQLLTEATRRALIAGVLPAPARPSIAGRALPLSVVAR